jgi:hypothetical protein
MSQFVDTGTKSFTAGATAQAQYTRVKLNSGVLEVAGLERAVGVLYSRMEANAHGTVLLPTKQGTMPMIANGAISANAMVYGAASGKISSTQGTGAFLEGVALEAAAADGDIIEVMPVIGDTAGV